MTVITSYVGKRVLDVGSGPIGAPITGRWIGYQRVRLDIDPAVTPDVCADARDLSSLEPSSFDGAFCSHNLEHYTPEDGITVLGELHRVLKRGGVIEVRVPDIGAVRVKLAEGASESDMAYLSTAGPITYADMIGGWSKELDRGNDYYRHKTSFDAELLGSMLVSAGFREVAVSASEPLELIALGVK